jgi:hypothetical protein
MLLGHWLLSLTQENAVDLHSVGKSPLTLATMGGETYGSSKKKKSLLLHENLATGRHLSDVLFTTSLKSNLLTGLTTQNTTEIFFILLLFFFNQTQTRLHFNLIRFNWNILVTGHKQWRI